MMASTPDDQYLEAILQERMDHDGKWHAECTVCLNEWSQALRRSGLTVQHSVP